MSFCHLCSMLLVSCYFSCLFPLYLPNHMLPVTCFSQRNDSAELWDLRDLWVRITETSIKSILKVLPERHPTRQKYLTDLDTHFTVIQESYPDSSEVRTKTSVCVVLWSYLKAHSLCHPPPQLTRDTESHSELIGHVTISGK